MSVVRKSLKQMDQMLRAMPGMNASEFSAVSVNPDGGFTKVSLESLTSNDKWLVLMFFPMGFGYIAPTELLALEEIRQDLENLNCSVVACSTDAAVIHSKFMSLAPSQGGVHGIGFPLLEDTTGDISESYGVLRDGSGYTFRAYFIIDSQGIVQGRVVSDLPVGLGIREIVDKVKFLKTATNSNKDPWEMKMYVKAGVKEQENQNAEGNEQVAAQIKVENVEDSLAQETVDEEAVKKEQELS